MKKKIVLGLVAVVAVASGVAALSAYEAHVINVTAHIENALYVHPDALEFGTVFPQEYIERQFTVELSSSFQLQDRLDDVNYVIRQKPKCVNEAGEYAQIDYATHQCPEGYTEMLSLCPFLSKLDGDSEDNNDTDHPSYFVDPDGVPGSGDEYCVIPGADATGHLTIDGGDLLDLWIVDLKVPPVDGYVGQDWPAGCPVVSANDQDYGCDLWIEVTGFSVLPEPEPFCGDGTVDPGEECEEDAHCTFLPNGSCNLIPGTAAQCQCHYPVQI